MPSKTHHQRTDRSIVEIIESLEDFAHAGVFTTRQVYRKHQWSEKVVSSALAMAVKENRIRRVAIGHYEWVPHEERNPDWPIHQKIRQMEEALAALRKGA